MITTLSEYQQEYSSFDELIGPDGQIGTHWRKLVRAYEKMTLDEMLQKKREVERQLRENGVTYNNFGDPDGSNRPWTLDPVPMIFSRKDWDNIEAGLLQRAELLNLILEDLYGARKLIRSGSIPFELVYNHRGFLRQADKIRIPGPHQLIQYSADLARGPNGQMWILRDVTDAPSGPGYALENRAAMTRVFPELLRSNHVRKLFSYYQTLRQTLSGLPLHNKDNPRIVLLSPGVDSNSYFEHAYLSSVMGFTLAFGEDLTVSDGYVWLKTIKGLERVDVILRRVADIDSDPLSFQGSSAAGVVGLMEAIRQQKVIVVNTLGSRILENPGFMAFMPKLSRELLGEDLLLPSVATWWCGQPQERQYVLDNLPHLIVKHIYRSNENKAVYGGELSKAELEEWRNRIKTRPNLYVGQEVVNFSTAPSLSGNRLEARNTVFRSFLVSNTEKASYQLMPGGLSRSIPPQSVFLIANRKGGISKDTWVVGKSKHDASAPTVPRVPHYKRLENVIPSRTGESLFWLGRYLERVVINVRLMRIVLRRLNETEEAAGFHEDEALVNLLKSLTIVTATQPGFTEEDTTKLQFPEEELISLAVDNKRVGSIAYSLQAFLKNGYSVRDRLSLDTWRIMESISENWSSLRQSDPNVQQIFDHLDGLIVQLMAFNGLNIDNMTREASWQLLNIGRFVESSIRTCTVLQSILVRKTDDEAERDLLEMVLMCNESLLTYRYRYRSNLEVAGVLELLLIEEDNPRSVVYQISRIARHLQQLPSEKSGKNLSAAEKKLLEALTLVRLRDISELASVVEDSGAREELYNFLQQVIDLLTETATLIINQYFSLTDNQYGFVKSQLPEI
ncbi:MAG: circularly permuted type 2 ATP-grasp protein [Saprospiraceae bacterium]